MTRFCAGYITMVGATLVTHPLDTLRVRVSVQPDSATYLQTARRVYTADGVRGLYGGFGATLIGAGPRGAIGFGVFETLKPYPGAVDYFPREPFCVEGRVRLPRRAAERVVHLSVRYGATAAAGARAASPIGRLGVLAAVASIYRVEGFLGLFKGISLNLVKNPIGTAISFTVNDHVKEWLGYEHEDAEDLGRKPTSKTGSAGL